MKTVKLIYKHECYDCKKIATIKIEMDVYLCEKCWAKLKELWCFI